LLAFCGDQVSRGELAYLGALTTAAITTHLSHVPIAFGLMLLCVLLRAFFAPVRTGVLRWTARLATPCVVAVALLSGVNWVHSNHFALARNSNVFLLAKWIDE